MTSTHADLDPYLELLAISPQKAPHELFPFLTQVRRASAWSALGHSPPRDATGRLHRLRDCTYEFWRADESKPRIRAAIATGKRAEGVPWRVYELLQMGAALAEFVVLPSDVLAYCRGRRAADEGRTHDAVHEFTDALAITPTEVRYAERLFPLRRAIGDAGAWREEFAYYASDPEHLVGHSLEPWLQFFIQRTDVASAQAVVEATRHAMQKLLDGDAGDAPRRYTVLSSAFHQSSVAQMERIITRQLIRLDKAIARAEKTAARKSRAKVP